MKITISAYGKFDLFRWAKGFEDEGMLFRLLTDIYTHNSGLLSRLRKDNENIDPAKISTFFMPRLFRALTKPWLSGYQYYESAFFDAWAAKKIKGADVFIGRAGCSLKSIRAAKEGGTKTILYRGSTHIVYQEDLIEEEYKLLGLPAPRKTDKRLTEMELMEYEECDRLYVPSTFAANSYAEKGMDPKKIITFPLSAEILSGSASDSEKKEKFTVLAVGSPSVRKGTKYLLEAAKILEANKDIEFVLIGPVSEEVKPYLGAAGENVKVLGQIPHWNLGDYYRGASVFCFPSIEDGFGQVLLEAMSFGLPVIATDHTGAPDLLGAEECGFIVPIRSGEKIAEKILKLYNDRALWSSMGRAAALKAKDFSVKNFISKWKTEFQKMGI